MCNLGYLRQAYRLPDGRIGWRCPAEPEAHFIAKGGDPTELIGRKCLCNGLMSSAGLALATAAGGRELPLVTAGDNLTNLGAIGVDLAGYAVQAVLDLPVPVPTPTV